jgi:hypothetical protein
VKDIGRMIAQLSETIRRTEEDAPKKQETEDEPQPRPEPESSGENALTDRQSRKGQISFAARKNSEAI